MKWLQPNPCQAAVTARLLQAFMIDEGCDPEAAGQTFVTRRHGAVLHYGVLHLFSSLK